MLARLALVGLLATAACAFAPAPAARRRPAGTAARLSLTDSETSRVASLRASLPAGSEVSDLWLAQRVLAFEDDGEAAAAARECLAWRAGAGADICASAAAAVAAAAAGGGWDNAPVLAAAPHASKIAPYLEAAITTVRRDDGAGLIFAIRAGDIDDKKLMGAVEVDELVDFFLYTKEVARIACDAATERTGKLTTIVTANALDGVNLFGSSAFRDVLSLSSKRATALYPSLTGPTLLLNLPPLLGALVKLFTPLFPKAVAAKIRFGSAKCKDLAALQVQGSPARAEFMGAVEALLA